MNDIRKYRFQFENPFFNDNSKGIALFDLIGTVVVAMVIDNIFNISQYIPGENKKIVYYILVFLLGILSHRIVAIATGKPFITFIDAKLFNFEFNFYKIFFILILFSLIYFIFN